MGMGTTILAIMLSLLFAFDVSANERNIKGSPDNPLNAHTKIEEPDSEKSLRTRRMRNVGRGFGKWLLSGYCKIATRKRRAATH
jgi:hypothetical protein